MCIVHGTGWIRLSIYCWVLYTNSQRKNSIGVKSATLLGCVLCDIHMPDNPAVRKKFAKVTPIPKHCVIFHENIGLCMCNVIEDHNLLKKKLGNF